MKKIRLHLPSLLILLIIATGLLLNKAIVTAATTVKVTSIQVLNLTSNYVILSEKEVFTAKTKILPARATNKGITWTTSDASVASVNSKGVVTAKSGGICEITATAKDKSKKRISYFVRVLTDTNYLCQGTWTSDYGNFNAGLVFSPTGSYSLSDIDAGNPIHYGTYLIDNQKRTIAFDGSSDEMEKVNETWSYSFPSSNKMLLTKGTKNITYTKSSKMMNKNYLCNRQGLLYSNKSAGISITGYIGTASSITIPSAISGKPVISISGLAGNTTIKKVILPDSITEISSYAFKDCIMLGDIVMPDGLRSILEGAFLGCSSLEGITLPKNLEVLEASIFEDCTSLSDVTIPEQITILFNHTFRNCSSLKKLTLPTGLRSIEPDALLDCENVTIYGDPDSYAQDFAKTNNINFIAR